jgi:hypothetical protein
MLVPPQEVCPFFAQKSYPVSLPRLQQQVRQEVSEPCSYCPAHQGTILNSFSPRETTQDPDNPLPRHRKSLTWREMHAGLTTRFFNHGPNNPPLQPRAWQPTSSTCNNIEYQYWWYHPWVNGKSDEWIIAKKLGNYTISPKYICLCPLRHMAPKGFPCPYFRNLGYIHIHNFIFKEY